MSEITNDIMWERLVIGMEMAEKLIQEKKLKLSDYEKADLGVRIANALFIEKNKSFRSDKIEKRKF